MLYLGFVNEAEFRYNALNDNLTPDQLEQSKEVKYLILLIKNNIKINIVNEII